ncbi:uncharacterized protein TNCV_1076771 [Trichonephila clavipes]|uniref:Uncharacterized protein n=1 Tax=Trichonephila clavipes TaxID=2585209 RepID=A0A8X6UY71_TRICX|nr:uncharacterized protein TNCV_1076771 [Trichonephila clavipes]
MFHSATHSEKPVLTRILKSKKIVRIRSFNREKEGNGDESIVAQVDENMFTLDDHPLNITVAVEQGEGIPQKARETLCSTPLTKAPKIGKSKRKPNASVKTAEALAEAANARKVAMEKDYQQIAQFREEKHRATMIYKKRTHFKDEGL